MREYNHPLFDIHTTFIHAVCEYCKEHKIVCLLFPLPYLNCIFQSMGQNYLSTMKKYNDSVGQK